jgi:hypothetical protein
LRIPYCLEREIFLVRLGISPILIDVLADGPPLALQLLPCSRRIICHEKFTSSAFAEDAYRDLG